MNSKTIVGVGVLVLFVVAGAAGTAIADQWPGGSYSIDQTPGEIKIIIVDTGNADSISLGAPNGNLSIPLNKSQGFYAGTSITIVETAENRTVPAESYFTTGATKTEEKTCWINHGGLQPEYGIGVNESVDIPCDGGEIAGPQNLDSVGQSDHTVLIEPGEEIEYQNGTYGVLFTVDGEERVDVTFTVGSGGPGEDLYDIHYGTDNNGNSLYGIIIVAGLLVMAALLAAVGLREVRMRRKEEDVGSYEAGVAALLLPSVAGAAFLVFVDQPEPVEISNATELQDVCSGSQTEVGIT